MFRRPPARRLVGSLLVAATGLAGCAHAPANPPQAASTTDSPSLCRTRAPFCRPAEEMARLLARAPLDVRAAEPVGRGRSGAQLLLLALPSSSKQVRVKWKRAGTGGDGYNRSPRRELAAWALQRLLVDGRDDVVPPTAVRCLPPALARAVDPTALDGDGVAPTFEGGACVLGSLSVWVERCHDLGSFDRRRFDEDPHYRRAVAIVDLLATLVDHHDTKGANFLVAAADRGRALRAFSVDNGMAFSGWRTPLAWMRPSWGSLVVPSLPADVVRRLRRIDRRALDDALATVAEFRDDRGQLVPTEIGAPLDPDAGVRRRGDRVQLGLTRREIDGVESRLRHVLSLIDAGDLHQF